MLRFSSASIWFVLLLCPRLVRASDCAPLTKDAPERITRYLQQRLVSGQDISPSIVSITPVPNSCYRKLTIAIPGVTHEVVMFLSPDERFLSSALYDLAADPRKEISQIAQNVGALLMRDQSPQRGSGKRLTIVEFADLECPYCWQFQHWYQSLPESLRSQTTLVFKHLPLDQHPWARSAALHTACASAQSPEDFWKLYDFLLTHQDEITSANLNEKIQSELPKSINTQALSNCILNGDGARLVERDMEVAKQLNVTGTPTLFLNGLRVLTLHSATEFRQLLERELTQQDSKRFQNAKLSGN